MELGVVPTVFVGGHVSAGDVEHVVQALHRTLEAAGVGTGPVDVWIEWLDTSGAPAATVRVECNGQTPGVAVRARGTTVRAAAVDCMARLADRLTLTPAG